jgi:alpha-tubulin suppressor-like RCC1 family protein
MTDGTVYIAGTNGLGELSSLCDVGSSLSNFTQYVMPTGTQISDIGTYYSNHIVFVMSDGSLYGTGYNLGYQLGFYGGGANGNTNVITNISIPENVPIPQQGLSEASITFDGNPSPFIHRTPTSPTESPAFFPVVAHNGSESVGIGMFSGETTSATHLFRSENKLAKTVWCGGLYTCVLMTDGTLYFAGKVPGIGIRSYGLIQSPDLPSGKTVGSISCGGNHLILLMTDGTIYGLGSNVNGNLGFHPMVSILREFAPIPIPDGKTVSKVTCGGNHTVVLMTDGTLYGTGYRGNGQLGGISPTRQYGLTQLNIPNNETVSLIMDELPAP